MESTQPDPNADIAELHRQAAVGPVEAGRWLRDVPIDRQTKFFGVLSAAIAGEDAAVCEQFEEWINAPIPDDPHAFYFRGVLRYRRSQNDDCDAALFDFERAAKLGGGWESLENYRMWAYDNLGLYDDLISSCNRLLAADATDRWAIFYRGMAFLNLGDPEAALADFDTSATLGLDHAQLYQYRAQAWSDLEDETRAAAAASEMFCHKPIPDFTGGNYHGLGHFFQRIGQPEIGLTAFAKALELEPDSTHHLGCRSNLLDSLGREEEADADRDRIAELNTRGTDMADKTLLHPLVLEHFKEAPLEALSVTDRRFPPRVAPDLQRAFERLTEAGFTIAGFHAGQQSGSTVQDFNQLYTRDRRNPAIAVPPKYIEFDIGEAEPVRAIRDGVWLLKDGEEPLCLLLHWERGEPFVALAAHNSPGGMAATRKLYKHFEDAITRSECYRGKVLSMEYKEMYNGQALGLMVHKIKKVQRDEVILPKRTVDLLDRNVMGFVQQRPALAKLGLAVKKGLLFYGPPGTGKTHTIHYLSGTVPGHTTFIISAEQVGNLTEYMTLARLLQPSMVVIEDVDLIARDRVEMRSASEEVMLNKLLNEMDGLKADSEILFVLTTNRPETLEAALAARPGRVDQAIEFPLPNAEGRAKLVRLYSQGVSMTEDVLRRTVDGTDRVTASFIKELMRRAIQHAIVRSGGDLTITQLDVDAALEEMLVTGGALNRKLLGAHAATESDSGT